MSYRDCISMIYPPSLLGASKQLISTGCNVAVCCLGYWSYWKSAEPAVVFSSRVHVDVTVSGECVLVLQSKIIPRECNVHRVYTCYDR